VHDVHSPHRVCGRQSQNAEEEGQRYELQV